MTDLERAQKIIEQYIHTLTWSPAATDDDITLVHGNVRGMASTIAAALAAVREEDALTCDRLASGGGTVIQNGVIRKATPSDCAAAIREKGRE